MTRWLRAQLFQVAPGDPRPIAAAALLLVLVALIAAAGPARRAARTDPMTTLRAEWSRSTARPAAACAPFSTRYTFPP